jgi:alpha-beta hydrolase superfamily lysophospholipase
LKSTTFTFKDDTGLDIFVYKWAPDTGTVKGSIQIAHGMAEHASRYERFATALTNAGYVVYANDHRGHGKTAGTLEKAGIYGDKDGFQLVVGNMHQLTGIIKKENPGSPIFLFGHSMGSFLTQGYLSVYGSELTGCILSGSAGNGGALVSVGHFIATIISMIGGRNQKSKFLDMMSFGAFNNAFKPNRTAFDWLSRDNAEVDKYINDPWCGFICTAGFFADLTAGLLWIHKSQTIKQIPVNLPIYFVSGSKDPVSAETKTIQELIKEYKNAGIKDVTFKFYENARHEILNETNKEEVTTDILNWISSHNK